MTNEPNAQQPDGGADALTLAHNIVHQRLFALGSIPVLSYEFADTYVHLVADEIACHARAPIPSVSPEREAVYRAVDAAINAIAEAWRRGDSPDEAERAVGPHIDKLLEMIVTSHRKESSNAK